MSSSMPAHVAIAILIGCVTACAQNCGQELLKLVADDGARKDSFGAPLAIDGSIGVVGARLNDDHGEDSGSAYLFDMITGEQLYKLLPDDGAAADVFGQAVAIHGTTVIAGAPDDDDRGAGSGSAYLFDAATGEQLFKLLAADGDRDDRFGAAVAISGTRAIVAAVWDEPNGSYSGSAYVFDTTTGEQLFKLLPDDGAPSDFFGGSVAISGTLAIVGAFRDDDNGADSGAVYVFDITTGEQLSKLLPDDGAAGDRFGHSVALSGDVAVIAADYDSDLGEHSGAVYVFDVTTGQQLHKLLPDEGAAADRFGVSVALSGATAVIGSLRGRTGTAYLFDVESGTQIRTLVPSRGRKPAFGVSVSISGDSAFIGAPADNTNGKRSGAAHVMNAACVCGGHEKIKKASCQDQNGANQLKVLLANGLEGDEFAVTLPDGSKKSGIINADGKGKIKFKNRPSGAGDATAAWGCGAADEKAYACP